MAGSPEPETSEKIVDNEWLQSESSFPVEAVDFEAANSFLRNSGYSKEAKGSDAIASLDRRIQERECQADACKRAISVLNSWMSFPRLVDKWKSTILGRTGRVMKELNLFSEGSHEYQTRKAEVWKVHYIGECLQKLLKIEESRPFAVDDIASFKEMLERNIMRFRKNLRHLIVAKDQALKGSAESGQELEMFAKILSASRRTHSLNMNKKKLFKIPPSLYLLSNLRILNLEYNNIGWLDPQIAQLQQLTKLYVAHNDIYELPLELAELKKTVCVLSLHGNPLRSDLWEKYKEGVQALLGYLEHLKTQGKSTETQVSDYLQKGRRTNTLSSTMGRANSVPLGQATVQPAQNQTIKEQNNQNANSKPRTIPKLQLGELHNTISSEPTLATGLLGRSPEIRKRMALKEDKNKGLIFTGVVSQQHASARDNAALEMGFMSMRRRADGEFDGISGLARSMPLQTSRFSRMSSHSGSKGVRFARLHDVSPASPDNAQRPHTSRAALERSGPDYDDPTIVSKVTLPNPKISARTLMKTIGWMQEHSTVRETEESEDPFATLRVPPTPVVKRAMTKGGLVLDKPRGLDAEATRVFSHWREGRIREYCTTPRMPEPREGKANTPRGTTELSAEDILKGLLESETSVVSTESGAVDILPKKKASTAPPTPRAKFFRL